MNKYVALLRGINISGKNRIDMSELKSELEASGFREVSTYLNSGNIVFVSEMANCKPVIENIILQKFKLDIPVYLIEMEELKDILAHSPIWWDSGSKDKYDNLIFILSSGQFRQSVHQFQAYAIVAGVYLPGEHCLLHGVDLKFAKPIFIGDTLTVTGVVDEVNDTFREITIKASIVNQDGKKVTRAVIRAGVAQ